MLSKSTHLHRPPFAQRGCALARSYKLKSKVIENLIKIRHSRHEIKFVLGEQLVSLYIQISPVEVETTVNSRHTIDFINCITHEIKI